MLSGGGLTLSVAELEIQQRLLVGCEPIPKEDVLRKRGKRYCAADGYDSLFMEIQDDFKIAPKPTPSRPQTDKNTDAQQSYIGV